MKKVFCYIANYLNAINSEELSVQISPVTVNANINEHENGSH